MAIPISLLRLFSGWQYAHDIFVAMDKLMAAVLGRSGKFTVSAECGADINFYPGIRYVLDHIQKNHCLSSAKHEGLIQELDINL
jgi:hypothetical protein